MDGEKEADSKGGGKETKKGEIESDQERSRVVSMWYAVQVSREQHKKSASVSHSLLVILHLTFHPFVP